MEMNTVQYIKKSNI